MLHDRDHDGLQDIGLARRWPAAPDDEVGEFTETAFPDDLCQQVSADQDVIVSDLGDGCGPCVGC